MDVPKNSVEPWFCNSWNTYYKIKNLFKSIDKKKSLISDDS
jgi:hypothetical protein